MDLQTQTPYNSHETIPDNENTDLHPYGPFKSYTWDTSEDWFAPGRYVVNMHKPWSVIEAAIPEKFCNVHAHVSTDSRDCDGGHGYQYTVKAADFPEMSETSDFEAYMLWSAVTLWEAGGVLTVSDKNTFDWSKPNDEGGYEAKTVQICYDWSCASGIDGDGRVYDQYAQMSGY